MWESSSPDALQSRQVYLIICRSGIVPLHKHSHIDRGIDYPTYDMQIVIVEHYGFGQVVLSAVHDVGQCAVSIVIFTRLHLDGQHFAVQFDDEIQLTAFLVVVIVWGDAILLQQQETR